MTATGVKAWFSSPNLRHGQQHVTTHQHSQTLAPRVQVPNNHILTQNLYQNHYYANPKYLILGYMDPLGCSYQNLQKPTRRNGSGLASETKAGYSPSKSACAQRSCQRARKRTLKPGRYCNVMVPDWTGASVLNVCLQSSLPVDSSMRALSSSTA